MPSHKISPMPPMSKASHPMPPLDSHYQVINDNKYDPSLDPHGAPSMIEAKGFLETKLHHRFQRMNSIDDDEDEKEPIHLYNLDEYSVIKNKRESQKSSKGSNEPKRENSATYVESASNKRKDSSKESSNQRANTNHYQSSSLEKNNEKPLENKTVQVMTTHMIPKKQESREKDFVKHDEKMRKKSAVMETESPLFIEEDIDLERNEPVQELPKESIPMTIYVIGLVLFISMVALLGKITEYDSRFSNLQLVLFFAICSSAIDHSDTLIVPSGS